MAPRSMTDLRNAPAPNSTRRQVVAGVSWADAWVRWRVAGDFVDVLQHERGRNSGRRV